MKLKKIQFNIYKLIIVSLMLDAYALFYIRTFPVTPFTIVSIIFVVLCIAESKENLMKIRKKDILLVLLIVCITFNYIFYGCKNSTSFLQSIYFIALCALAYRKETKANFDSYCDFFQHLMTVMSIYGIYQFFGRILNLPFTDLIIPGHMVKGYNWTNTTYVSGLNMYRSNAVFREPSFFGQMLAISLLLYVPGFLNKKVQFKDYLVPTILQAIALILAISGTGFFMIGIGLILYLLLTRRTRKTWERVFAYLILGILVVPYILLVTSFGSYLLSRMNELLVYNKDASSGYVRFRSWIFVVEKAWNKNFLLGSGIGTGADYVSEFAIQFYAMTLNGFARVATELGLSGLGLWMGYLLSGLKVKETSLTDSRFLILACSMVPLVFMHETFASNIFWGFMMLMNIRFVEIRKA